MAAIGAFDDGGASAIGSARSGAGGGTPAEPGDAVGSLPAAAPHPASPLSRTPPLRAARRLLLEAARRARLDLVHAGQLELLHGGDAHFARLEEALATARREVSIEMYQVRPDRAGDRFFDRLTATAARGVRVRLLVDAFGSHRVARRLDPLRRAGVEVLWYNPLRPWRAPLRRTHRKLVVVDGAVASIGGINVAAEFSASLHGDRAWRDVSVWGRGPLATVLRRQFESAWLAAGGRAGAFLPVDGSGGELCALAGGRDGRSGHGPAYLALAGLATRELALATPYFMPDRRLRRALCAAAERGVRVVVVIPRLCDIGPFKHAGRRLYGDLLRAGVEIWERTDRMVHAKVAVADGLVAAVGSANLNRQSFHNNAETLLLTGEARVVREIRHLILEEPLGRAERLCWRGWNAHPDRRRWAELAAAGVSLVF